MQLSPQARSSERHGPDQVLQAIESSAREREFRVRDWADDPLPDQRYAQLGLLGGALAVLGIAVALALHA